MRGLVTAAWLTGILSQADPQQYPKLETLTAGEERPAPAADPKEAAGNARAWGAWLKAVNK
jgi:hypothetical protein